jgi:hypothetical protein
MALVVVYIFLAKYVLLFPRPAAGNAERVCIGMVIVMFYK